MSEFNPKSLEYCDTLDCDTFGMCIDCVVRRLENSYEGRLLAWNPPRYAKWVWEDKDRFKQFMGPDVDPFGHGPHQARAVAIPMVELQNMTPGYRPFTKDEAKMLVLGHTLHDAHEGLTGDVAYPDKTAQTYEDELKVNLETIRTVLGLPNEDPFIASYRAVVGDLESWSFAGRAFAAGEYCGYFLTGMRAWAMRGHSGLDPNEAALCEDMGREVVSSARRKLESNAHEFAFCQYLLDAHKVALGEINA